MEFVVYFLTFSAVGVISLLLGVSHERKRWNKLITRENGIGRITGVFKMAPNRKALCDKVLLVWAIGILIMMLAKEATIANIF